MPTHEEICKALIYIHYSKQLPRDSAFLNKEFGLMTSLAAFLHPKSKQELGVNLDELVLHLQNSGFIIQGDNTEWGLTLHGHYELATRYF